MGGRGVGISQEGGGREEWVAGWVGGRDSFSWIENNKPISFFKKPLADSKDTKISIPCF